MSELLRIQSYIRNARDLYETHERSFNALIMGNVGTGKTRLASTCRFPVLLHSFDPGGSTTKALQPFIQKGDIIVDSRFEIDDGKKPKAFKLWESEIAVLKQMGMFDEIGTFYVDGLTSIGSAIMNYILANASRANSVPQQQDYLLQQITLTNLIKDLVNLPCDVIMTGHIGTDKDEVTGKMVSSLFVSGKLTIKIPMLFSELYIAVTKATSKGVDYKLLTTADGLYQARTRIGEGVFDTFEEPNIKALLRKAKYEAKDRAPITNTSKEEPDAMTTT